MNDEKAAGRTRVQTLAEGLRRAIEAGEYPVGGKLPSEAALTAQHGVSRTVVREAVAALRTEGLVAPRQGAGVFVIGPPAVQHLPFTVVEAGKLSSLVEMMELRIAVETEAASLAAMRASPAQIAAISEALSALDAAASAGQPTSPLDYEFHIAIARATNNPRFEQFLAALGAQAIPRAQVGREASAEYQAQLRAEHRQVAGAVAARESEAAGRAMRAHLEGGMRRYRALQLENGSL